ncbi:hypothetical protein, partial [uncultured Campylobacter sp.]|uniref:hypothetical protein n=1 Tax=uncultured Campylobacter sp. TaxID=218934 RepID=UPI00261B46AF
MVKIKLSALACAILVGGGQLVAEDFYIVNINNETKIITGHPWESSINVDNNGTLISRVSEFRGPTDININNSKAIFENRIAIRNPHLHIINNSTLDFNEELTMWDGDGLWPVIEKDNDFSGGNLSLDNNSTLDVKGEAEFDRIDVLINGSTATIDNLTNYDSKIYVVNDSELKINKDALFVRSHLIVKDDSNATINGALSVVSDYTIDENDEFVVNDGGIKIDKSNLNVEGEVQFYNVDTELNNSSIANFKDKLTLFDSAMLLKNGSSLNVEGEVNFDNSALVVQNGSKVMFNDKFTMRNRDEKSIIILTIKDHEHPFERMKNEVEKSIIILDNGSEINIKGDFENHGVIYYGASADSAPKITVDGKATLMGTTEIGIYATSGDISNLNQAVFLESKGAIENQATDENIYAMYFDPDNEDANAEGLVKYDQNIIDADLKLSEDGKKLLVQILMSGDMQNRPINEKIDFIAESTQAAGVNLTAQDLDIITSLFTMGDAKGNGAIATEAIKLADQAKQGNQEAAQIISKTAQSIQKNSQDS